MSSSLNYKKVSGDNFVNGVSAGTCVAFTIDKVGNANYTPKANDVTVKNISIPPQ